MEKQEGEARGRSRHKNNAKSVVRNQEEKNVGTNEKNPKQDLTSAKDLTIELPEGRKSPYHKNVNLHPQGLWVNAVSCPMYLRFQSKIYTVKNIVTKLLEEILILV